MSQLDMTEAEREAFLADVHVGVLSIARRDKGPLALPVWYLYEPGGEVLVSMDGSSLKARLLGNTGRATLTAQVETPPYRYVMVEGPVVIEPASHDGLALASRYLGPELGAPVGGALDAREAGVVVGGIAVLGVEPDLEAERRRPGHVLAAEQLRLVVLLDRFGRTEPRLQRPPAGPEVQHAEVVGDHAAGHLGDLVEEHLVHPDLLPGAPDSHGVPTVKRGRLHQ